jgi:hypothetical protein
MTSILAVLALVLFSPTRAPQAPTQPTGKISGVVSDSSSNRPIPNVVVRLVRWEGGLGQQIPPVRTGEDGRFEVQALRAGDYGLTFTGETFVTLEWGQKRPSEPARRVALADGQVFDKADMMLPRTSAIEGRLIDEFGDPAPGMTVQAARVQFVAGKNRLVAMPGAQSRPTDDRGQFRIFNLPPSDYYLVALSGHFAGSDEAGFALTYFPGTTVPLEAKPVFVDLGQDVTGVVFQMAPAELSTISGVAVDENGKPTQAMLMLTPTSGGDVRATIMARLQTGPDGAFVIRNLPAGSYALQGFGRPVGSGGNLGNSAFGALQLTVAGDQSDLTLKIAPGATLRGRILFEGGVTPPAPGRVRVSPQPINFATGPMGGGPPESIVNEDWTFETKNMTGTRVISAFAGAPGWMVKRVERDGKEITDQPVDFSKGDVSGVDITLTSSVGIVTGTVTEAGQPAPESAVLLFAEDAAKWTFPSRYMTVARPDAKGVFTTGGLPSGNYLAIAIPPMQGQDWQDPMTLHQYRALATSVNVVEGSKASVALRVVRR